jgi:hypothetical protein
MKHKFLIFNFKFLIPFFALWAMNVQAVTVEQVAGTYQGTLSIDDEPYPNEKIYILPGTEAGRITFVLPDFRYNGAPLGDIVLVNVGMSNSGELTIDETSLYIKAIRARATISSTGSTLSATSAQIGLEIGVAAVPMPIPVTFSGQKQTSANYAITNGGFEGAWTSNEPQGWHSFGTATGDYASFVTGNTGQFQQSSDTRPGSTGSHSALLQSKTVLGVSANGNCTNGRINAGSMSATDANGNYSFSEPGSSYTTPFVGQPDSLVFWAKYLPGGGSIEDASNQASAHAVLTTNARYQDPESSDYSTVKIGEATARFSATTELGWRRVSVPFSYTSVDPKQMAYMLITFSTNKTPGGGNSTKKSPDNLYIDDAEMVYNYGLKSLTLDGQAVSFTQGVATLSQTYSDSEYSAVVTTDGRAAKSFIGYDAETYSMYVYVVADNYSQSGDYTVYRVQMTVPEVPVTDTYYSYEATTCDNAAYSDELFQELTEAGTYVDTIPNMQGGDSIVTLTLRVLPTYRMEETLYRTEIDTIWRGQAISGLAQQAEPYLYYDVLEAANGCDSTYVLRLYISDIPVTYGVYEAQMCEGESVTYEGVTYSEAYEGDIHVAKKNQYGGDSIVHLTVTVLPNYTIDEYKTIHEGAQESWEGWNLSTMPVGEMTLDAWYYTEQDCDSTLILHLTVLPKQLETGVGDVQSTNVQCTKVVIDGQMYIRRGEELFDPIGRKIRK